MAGRRPCPPLAQPVLPRSAGRHQLAVRPALGPILRLARRLAGSTCRTTAWAAGSMRQPQPAGPPAPLARREQHRPADETVLLPAALQ
eukprot:13108794-Alexandrium_andersonii.AAC.1